MDAVSWSTRPRLRRPVLVAAFEGWNDAADAASIAARYLREKWSGTPFATIDPEEFFDFSQTRPRVRLVNGVTREIAWPTNEFAAASVPGARHDLVVLSGVEPQLRWRTFCEQVLSVVHALGVEIVITFGALLSDVPHTRPVQITGTSAELQLVEPLGLTASRYEGPTGIVGVLNDACRRQGVPSASLWASVPHYVGSTPSPKAALALVQRCTTLLSVNLVTTDLEIASATYEREVDEVVAADEEISAYVQALEEQRSDGEQIDEEDLPSGETLAEELERFLREHDEGQG